MHSKFRKDFEEIRRGYPTGDQRIDELEAEVQVIQTKMGIDPESIDQTTEISNIETAIGLSATGTKPSYGSTEVIQNSHSLMQALAALDTWAAELVINVLNEDLNNSGSVDNYTVLDALLTAIGSTATDLFFPRGTYKLSSDITIPSNVRLIFANGAKLSPDSGKTITINGTIEAGLYQIFTGSGSIAGTFIEDNRNVEWFGILPDGSDISSKIYTLTKSFNMLDDSPIGVDGNSDGVSDGWTITTGANITLVKTIDGGYQKMEITASSSTASSYMTKTLSVTPGDILNLSSILRVSGNLKITAAIAWYTVGSAFISETLSGFITPSVDTIGQIVNVTAPATAATARIRFYIQPLLSGDVGSAWIKNGYLFSSTVVDNMKFKFSLKGDYVISNHLCLPSSIILDIKRKSIIKRANGAIVSIFGEIEAGAYKIFDDDGGNGSFSGDLQNTEGYPEWFGALGGSTDDTIPFEKLRSILGMGVIKLTKPLYTAHVHLTNGIYLEGRGMESTTLKGAVQATPIITVGDTVLAQYWGWRDLTIDAVGIDVGVYITNAYYGYSNRYKIMNAILDNYLVENQDNKSVMLIYNHMVHILNGLRYNIRSEYDTSKAGSSFNTTVQFTDTMSYNNTPSNTTSGKCIRASSELLYDGYVEGDLNASNHIELDKTPNGGANAGGLLKVIGALSVDGNGTNNVVVLKGATPQEVQYFIRGAADIDGYIDNQTTGLSQIYYGGLYGAGSKLLSPQIQGYISIADNSNKGNSQGKAYPLIYNSAGALYFDTNRADSLGLMTHKTYDKPERISGVNNGFNHRVWCDSTNGVMRSKNSAPASETDGAIFTNQLVSVPATLSATGITGQYACDSNYFYFCYATNTWAKFIIDTPRLVVDRFDDFIYQTLVEANTNWILNKGTFGTDPAIGAPSSLYLVTGGNSGSLADDGSQIVDHIPVRADYGGLVVEASIKIDTSISGLSVFVGLTDTKTMEEPVEVHSGTCTFTIATDRVNVASHGLVNGDILFFETINITTGIELMNGIVPRKYYIVNATSDDFQVAITYGGAAVDLQTADGTGTFRAFHRFADDAVGFVYDDAAAEKSWFAFAMDGQNIDNNSKTTSIAPSTSAFQKMKITVDSTGNTVKFYINDVLVGNMPGTALGVSPDVSLYLTVIANATGAASKTVQCDYLRVTHNRP